MVIKKNIEIKCSPEKENKNDNDFVIINNINNINDVNKINTIYNNSNPPNPLTKTMSSEINDNLNSPQIDEEINLPNDRFHFEDENFNKGMINETIDTIPINEEKSLGDTSFGGDINEFLFKSMMTKKKSVTEETITEEFNSSSSKNLKKLNLLGNQDSQNNINASNNINDLMLQTNPLSQPFLKPPFNFSLTPNKNNLNLKNNYQQLVEFNPNFDNNNNNSSSINQEDNNDLNTCNNNENKENNENGFDKQNNKFHQIRTIYDIINLKLKNSSNEKEDSKEKNKNSNNNSNNIINNISNKK